MQVLNPAKWDIIRGESMLIEYSIGEKGTIEENSHRITVKCKSDQDCIKKLRRYLNDMYEMKGRQLRGIGRYADRLTFIFCGRTITMYEIQRIA